jgi:2'-5' RNA ligase
MTDLVIGANARLVEKFHSDIVLDKNGCLPHISLAMGCVDSEKLPLLSQALEPLIENAPRRLKSLGITKSFNSAGVISSVSIERSAELQSLHEKICNIAKPFFTFDVAESMLAGGRADASTLEWIRSYSAKSAYKNFSPHITIGFGDLDVCKLSDDFTVSRFAICRLANHCTCVKVLWSIEI